MVKDRETDWTLQADEVCEQALASRYRRRFEDVSKLKGFLDRAHNVCHTSRAVVSTSGSADVTVVINQQDATARLLAFAAESHVRDLTIVGLRMSPSSPTVIWRVEFAHNVLQGGRPLTVSASGPMLSQLRDALLQATVATRSKRPQHVLPALAGEGAELERFKQTLQRRSAVIGGVAGFATSAVTLVGRAVIG